MCLSFGTDSKHFNGGLNRSLVPRLPALSCFGPTNTSVHLVSLFATFTCSKHIFDRILVLLGVVTH